MADTTQPGQMPDPACRRNDLVYGHLRASWNTQPKIVKQNVGCPNSPELLLCNADPMQQEHTHLGDRLKDLRADRRESVQEVADAVGMSRSYLSGIENGHDYPGREYLVALANYYGVSLDWLTTGEGNRDPSPRPLTVRAVKLMEAFDTLPEDEQEHLLTICEFRARRLLATVQHQADTIEPDPPAGNPPRKKGRK